MNKKYLKMTSAVVMSSAIVVSNAGVMVNAAELENLTFTGGTFIEEKQDFFSKKPAHYVLSFEEDVNIKNPVVSVNGEEVTARAKNYIDGNSNGGKNRYIHIEMNKLAENAEITVSADGFNELTFTMTPEGELVEKNTKIEVNEITLVDKSEAIIATPDYYAISFKGEETEIVDFLEAEGTVKANGEEIKAKTTNYIDENKNGGANIYLHIDKDQLTKEDNEIVIEKEGYEPVTFNLKGEAKVEQPKVKATGAEFVEKNKGIMPTPNYYAVSFEGEEEDIINYLKEDGKVILNGEEVPSKVTNYTDENVYGGPNVYLHMESDKLTAAENTVTIEREGYAPLTFKIDAEGKLIEEIVEPEVEEGSEISAKGATLVDRSEAIIPAPNYYAIEFNGEEDEIADFLKAEGTVKVNGEVVDAKTANYIDKNVNGGANIYLHINEDKFTKDVNEVTIEREGYDTLTFFIDKEGKLVEKEVETGDKPVNHTKRKKSKKNKKTNVVVSRISGTDRVNTAVEVSKKMYAKGTKNVVIANMNQFADVLTATPLAAQLNAPILFVSSNNAPKATMDEIKRLGAENVVIIGGEGSVSKDVEKQLEGKKIERLSGTDRYETSVKIAEKVREKGNKAVVEVANGTIFADGLSMSSLAVKENAPIVLVQKEALPTSVQKAVLSWAKDVKTVNIAGMHGSVSEKAEKVIAANTNIKVNRFGGADRYETSAKIANKANPNATSAVMTSGEEFADALVAGPFAAKNNSKLLLVKTNEVPKAVKDSAKGIKKFSIVGGANKVSEKVVETLKNIVK